jgi:hypothetical protein
MHAAKDAMTTHIYLDMLQLFFFPQTDGIEQEEGEILCQQYGAPPHFIHEV